MAARVGKIALVVGTLAVVGIGACRALLPERFAVNAPLGFLLFGRGVESPAPGDVQKWLRAPEGMVVELYARDLPNARWMRFTPAGDLLVTTPRSGRVMQLARDGDGDGRPDAVRVLLEGLDRPHGIDLHDGWLYVSESARVLRVRYDAAGRTVAGPPEPVIEGLPEGGNHWTRTVGFGPDGWLYLSVGSSCNVCLESDPRRAALLRFRADGSGEEIFATGLRNAVGFDWQPGTGALYATDNGRDLLGDDFPPCELNRVVSGGFFGWPVANGDRVPDPDFGAGAEERIRSSIPPAHAFGAHNAPLGIRFLRDARWPEPWRGAAIVALHGSWNRSRKDGYRLVSLHWSGDGRIEERPFVTGFLDGDTARGRPVDVAEGPDGALYVSDDYAGAIYRVRLASATSGAEPAAPAASTASSASGGAPADPLRAIPPAERAAAGVRGAALYEAHACFRCHEPDRAEAGVVPAPLADLPARWDVDSLAAFLAAPTPPMPAFPLDAAARRDLAVFLLAPAP